MSKAIEVKIAEKVKENGGRTFYVGGYVRDKLLNIENKDVDIEVHGITGENLFEILKTIGEPIKFGDSFGVYSLKGYDIDIAMPRSEKAIGKGHRDFEILVDPFIGLKKASQRRDFTINSLMQDVLTGEIIDNFMGMKDLENGILRCVDPTTFIEDPLRVLRAAQFASRFNFKVEDKTIELCRNIDLTTLTRERVFKELEKALVKGQNPSIFFNTLKDMHQLSYWFKEVENLIGIKQDPIYHPEGDAYIHTMEVLDRTVLYKDKTSNPLNFALLALCHDFGKAVTTKMIDGRIHSYDHENKGLPLINCFLNRLTNEKAIKRYVMNMVPLHMRLPQLIRQKSKDKSFNKVFDEAISKEDLILFTFCDNKKNIQNKEEMYDHLAIYQKLMLKPYIKGNDLIKNGIETDENFSTYLEYAHKLRLSGLNKEEVLKQTLSYIKKCK